MTNPEVPEDDRGLSGDSPVDVSEIVLPRKIPDIDDEEAQIKALTGAMISAFLTATEMPIHMLMDVMQPAAKQMVAFGVRQTDRIDPEAVRPASWVVDGATERAQPVPEQQNHTTAAPPVVRTAEAPAIPKRFKAGARAQEIAVVTEL